MENFTNFLTQLYYPILAFFATASLYLMAIELEKIRKKME
jgi:hypothetical protein